MGWSLEITWNDIFFVLYIQCNKYHPWGNLFRGKYFGYCPNFSNIRINDIRVRKHVSTTWGFPVQWREGVLSNDVRRHSPLTWGGTVHRREQARSNDMREHGYTTWGGTFQWRVMARCNDVRRYCPLTWGGTVQQREEARSNGIRRHGCMT